MSNSKPASPAGGSDPSSKERQADEALRLMQRALGLLDEAEGPDEVGAHLDLAMHRLQEWIERKGA